MPLEANPRISLNRVRKAMYNKMTTAKAKKTKPVDYVTNFDATVNILNQNYARLAETGQGEEYIRRVKATIQEIIASIQK